MIPLNLKLKKKDCSTTKTIEIQLISKIAKSSSCNSALYAYFLAIVLTAYLFVNMPSSKDNRVLMHG